MSLLEPDLICKRLGLCDTQSVHCLLLDLHILTLFMPSTNSVPVDAHGNYAVYCKQIRLMMTNRIFIQCSIIDSSRMRQSCEYNVVPCRRTWLMTIRVETF